jgi:hypothetical protein
MNNYTVSSEFKTQVTAILSTKKFSAVFAYMNLVNREGFSYNEQELNSIVQFLGEFPYNEVSEFFQILPTLVSQEGGEGTIQQPTSTLEQEPATADAI